MITAPLPPARPRTSRPLPVASPAHAWRYPRAQRPRWGVVFAILCSVTLHGMVLLGVNPRPARAVVATAAQETFIQMEMPPIPPDETEETYEELAESDAAPQVSVPQLADVPSIVPLADFVQTLDLRPQTNVDANALRQMTIPVNFGRGGSGSGVANVFNLADLDRLPEAVAQPAPNFPHEPRRLGIDRARIVVSFIVDSEGRVVDPQVVEASHDGFTQAAVTGVARWKFRPGVKGGRRVATRMMLPLLFVVHDEV